MSKKIVLLSAVLAIVGAGIMLFAHRNAEAKVCFVTDGDCGGEIDASTPNVEACANLNYNCSSGNTTSCNYKNNNNFVEWISARGGNANSDGAWNTLKCPLNQDYWMYCPKGFRLACGANYTSSLTCGQYKNCECKNEFKYDGPYYNGQNGPKTGEGVDPCAQKCHGRGEPCLEVSIDGTFDSSNPKYPACICEHPYVVTKSQCEEAGAQVANMNDFCQPSSAITDGTQCNTEGAPEKYYRGCFCPPEYQYTVASCDGEVGGLKCTNESGVDLWTSCFNCEDLGFHASLVEIDSHVRHTQASLGADPAVSPCIANDETCMSNFTSSTVDNHPVYNKSNNYMHAYAEPSNQWPQVLWKDLAKYSYLQCPLQSNHGLYDNYYIVDCAEPGMRPSTSNDLRPDGVTYYHDGEACVPDSCANVVKTILRTDEGIASKYGLFYPQGVPIPGYDAHDNNFPEGSHSYFIDGNGLPIVERYVNTKSGGVYQSGFNDTLPANLRWNSDGNIWEADNMPSGDNYLHINGSATISDTISRKIAIVLSGEDYYGVDTVMVVDMVSNNHTQNIDLCKRQVCMPVDGSKNFYYTSGNGYTDSTTENTPCQGQSAFMINPLKFLDYIIPSAHAAIPDYITARVCKKRNWDDKYFWKFASEGLVYGNETKVYAGESNALSGGLCGNYAFGGCYDCWKKNAYMWCSAHETHTIPSTTPYNNCMANTSTGPDDYTPMRLQTQNDGFCVQTVRSPVAFYVGLKGAPADEYISIKEFYRVIQNYPTHGGGHLLSSQKKSTYLSMMERSCKVGDNDPNPKIRYTGSVFPADDETYDDRGARNASLSFKGIDFEFTANPVYIYRKFNFEDGNITTNKRVIFRSASGDDTIANSTLYLAGVDGLGYGSNLPANLIDTDVDFCGILSFANNVDEYGNKHGDWMTNLTNTGSSVIQKINNCPANTSATLYIGRQSVISNKYKYVLDNLVIDAANAGENTSDCLQVGFLGTQDNDIYVSNTISLQGMSYFEKMNISAKDIVVNPKTAVSSLSNYTNPPSATMTYANMNGSILTMRAGGLFTIFAPAVIDDYGDVDNSTHIIFETGNRRYNAIRAKIDVQTTIGSWSMVMDGLTKCHIECNIYSAYCPNHKVLRPYSEETLSLYCHTYTGLNDESGTEQTFDWDPFCSHAYGGDLARPYRTDTMSFCYNYLDLCGNTGTTATRKVKYWYISQWKTESQCTDLYTYDRCGLMRMDTNTVLELGNPTYSATYP